MLKIIGVGLDPEHLKAGLPEPSFLAGAGAVFWSGSDFYSYYSYSTVL